MIFCLLCLATAVALAAPVRPPESPPPLSYSVHTAMGVVPVHVLTFSPDTLQARLLFPPEGKTLSTVDAMPGCARALACFNASFFRETDKPIGLLVSEGKVLQKVQKVSWGVFWIDGQHKAHIVRRKTFERKVELEDVEFAVQSGPTLLLDGKILDRKSTPAIRTAIGIDSEGRVKVLVARLPITLEILAGFGKKELSLQHLMNLDGGSSSQLFLHAGEEVSLTAGPVAVGVGLYLRSAVDSGQETIKGGGDLTPKAP